MAAFVLVHGAGGSAWEWHLVTDRLRAAGHEVVDDDLPVDDERADLAAHVAVVEAGVERARATTTPVVLAAHSYGAWFATAAAGRGGVDALVLVAPMLPRPGERAADWWAAVHPELAPGHGLQPWHDDEDADVATGLTGALATEAHRRRRHQAATTVHEPWPLPRWPDVPTTVVLGDRDGFLRADVLRRAAAERVPRARVVALPAGHAVPLEDPDGCTRVLLAQAGEVARTERLS